MIGTVSPAPQNWSFSVETILNAVSSLVPTDVRK